MSGLAQQLRGSRRGEGDGLGQEDRDIPKVCRALTSTLNGLSDVDAANEQKLAPQVSQEIVQIRGPKYTESGVWARECAADRVPKTRDEKVERYVLDFKNERKCSENSI